jgi:sigma-E factor negative regulatory protein RseB
LFSFSININRATANSSDQLLRTGRRTVSTTVRDNAEITVVGELPPQRRSVSPTALNSGQYND